MSELHVQGGIVQSEIVIFMLIDVSGSMEAEGRIGAVNEAMREVPAQLVKVEEDSEDAKLLIAPMEFSSGAQWFALSNDKPAPASEFRWINRQASGITDLGAAFDLLQKVLTEKDKGGWMNGRGGVAPIVILITDGAPTDDWKTSLDRLKLRGWFRAAAKYAVAIDKACNFDVLEAFTGNSEAIVDCSKIRLNLATIIKKVVVSVSKTMSQTKSGVIGKDVNTPTEVTDEPASSEGTDIGAKNLQSDLTIADTDALFD